MTPVGNTADGLGTDAFVAVAAAVLGVTEPEFVGRPKIVPLSAPHYEPGPRLRQ